MNEPADWDLERVPVAARDARIREVLLGYCQDALAPMSHLVNDTSTRDDIAELAMGFAKIYRDDLDAAQGRRLTIARLSQDLQTAREQALEEAQ